MRAGGEGDGQARGIGCGRELRLRGGRTFLTGAVVLAVVIVPFALWGPAVEAAVVRLTYAEIPRPAVAAAVVLLLTADTFLPVPSSLVSTVSGELLGFAGGAAASFAGMWLGCLAGYAAGRWASRWTADRLEPQDRVRRAAGRWGIWMLAVFRPVPVLAEASVLWAGLNRVPFGRFAVVTSASSLGIACAYAWAGAVARSQETFFLAFAASTVLPGLLLLTARGWGPRSTR